MKKFLNEFFGKKETSDEGSVKPAPKPSVIVERQDKDSVYLVDNKYILQKSDQGFLIRSLSGAPQYYLVKGRLLSELEVNLLFSGNEVNVGEYLTGFKIPFDKVSVFMYPAYFSEYCYDGEIRYYYDNNLQEKWDSSQTGTEPVQ